ncbi:MAG: carbohydrate kinase family protein [Candidatus Geothermarchaeales archaeon]
MDIGAIIDRIRELQGRVRVAVLPDFFVDRILRTPPMDDLKVMIEKKALAGGGSIHGVSQIEMRGGNAPNLAYALGRIGLQTHLVTVAEGPTEALLQSYFRDLDTVSVSVVPGKPGYTTSLEFEHRGRGVNVMLSDVGDIATLGPEKLREESWEAILDSDIVAIVNWAANLEGTRLARRVFSACHERGIQTFLDPADITVRERDLDELIESVLIPGVVDFLSINENETRSILKLLGLGQFPERYREKDMHDAARSIWEELSVSTHIHTPTYSCVSENEDTISVPCYRVQALNLTGAGDVWDAGCIAGILARLEPEKRLNFSNAAAAAYVSDPEAKTPTLQGVERFLLSHGVAAA